MLRLDLHLKMPILLIRVPNVGLYPFLTLNLCICACMGSMNVGVREETVESSERDQGSGARPQHFRRRDWRLSHQSR